MIFGIIRLDGRDFRLRNQPHLRGHSFTLNHGVAVKLGKTFFSTRVINLRNNLPADTTVFTDLQNFRSSLTEDDLLRFCVVNFAWCFCCMRF